MSMVRRILARILAVTAALLPLSAFAQTGPEPDLGPIGLALGNILIFINSYIIPAIFAIAFVMFIWGMFLHFIMGGANEENREKGKQLAIWGIVGFILMVSLWGLVYVIGTGLGFTRANAPDLPKVPTTGGGGATTGGSAGVPNSAWEGQHTQGIR